MIFVSVGRLSHCCIGRTHVDVPLFDVVILQDYSMASIGWAARLDELLLKLDSAIYTADEFTVLKILLAITLDVNNYP